MTREPKVACIELNCWLRDYEKNNIVCAECKSRLKFLAMIGSTGLPTMPSLYTWGEELTLRKERKVWESLEDG